MDVSNTVGKDEPTDECGFLGIGEHYRQKRKLTAITEEEFLGVMFEHQKRMREIMLNIKEIDKDHNGYVTRNELDDECISSISLALVDNTAVSRLNLAENVISSEGAEYLFGIFETNKTLHAIKAVL